MDNIDIARNDNIAVTRTLKKYVCCETGDGEKGQYGLQANACRPRRGAVVRCWVAAVGDTCADMTDGVRMTLADVTV